LRRGNPQFQEEIASQRTLAMTCKSTRCESDSPRAGESCDSLAVLAARLARARFAVPQIPTNLFTDVAHLNAPVAHSPFKARRHDSPMEYGGRISSPYGETASEQNCVGWFIY